MFYPLVFTPIYKERIWGGSKLRTWGKDIPEGNIGESWEISTVKNDVSRVATGPWQGLLLTDLIEKYPEAILGKHVYERFGTDFPLLIKFIDAREDLSIQVHPNDALALKNHGSFGKTEMWYVLDAEDDARLVLGFTKDVSEDEFLDYLDKGQLSDLLHEVSVKKGDVFYLETGTIHAIGAGVMIAEIQQTSDVTYRVYDWDRVDASGNARELHLDRALEAMNYKETFCKREYSTNINVANAVVESPYFITNTVYLRGLYSPVACDSFRIYMVLKGSVKVVTDADSYVFERGNTFLIPAVLGYELEGEADLLEVFI